MRIAIISDVHGNVRALEAVLAEVRARGPFDQILNGGDLADFGAAPVPREAMARLRAEGFPAIIGNTDQWVAGLTAPPGPVLAMRDWTRGQLTEDDVAFLRALPMSRRVEPPDGPPLVLVHATPTSTTDSVNPDAPSEALTGMLRDARTETLAYGHIHRPVAVRGGAGRHGRQRRQRRVPVRRRAAPRCDDLLHARRRGFRWHREIVRVSYDTEAVAQELAASDHPAGAVFAERVRTGRME